MSGYEVPNPILNSPFHEPAEHWNIVEGEEPERLPGRRPAMYFYRDPAGRPDSLGREAGTAIELVLVNRIRRQVKAWRDRAGLPGGVADDPRPAPMVAARRPPAAAVLRPARSGRDDHLPRRSARRFPPRTQHPLRGTGPGQAGPGLSRLPALCLQDGHRDGQDDRDGHARRLEHPEQGARPQRARSSPTSCSWSART